MAFNYSPKVVTDGLVLYLDAANPRSYPGSGTTWSDISRGGNNGTLVNGPTYSSANGGSIVFDGSNDYVDLGTNDSLNPVNSMTLGCWVYFNSLNRREIFIGKGDGTTVTTSQYWMEKRLDNQLQMYLAITVNPWEYRLVLSNFTIQNNQWYYMCATYDRQTFKAYINGIQNASTYSITSPINTTTRPLSVGKLGNYNGLNLSGRISNTQLYNRALSASEILQNYNAHKSRYGLT